MVLRVCFVFCSSTSSVCDDGEEDGEKAKRIGEDV